MSRQFLMRMVLGAGIFFAALCMACASGVDSVKTKPIDIPIAEFYKPAAYARAVLSPDGEKLAVLVYKDDRYKLAIFNIEKRSLQIVAGSDDWDIVSPAWVNNSRVMFRISDNKATEADNHGGGLFAINVDGTSFRRLGMTIKQAMAENTVYRPLFAVRRAGGESNDILVAYNERNGESDLAGFDVYRMDTMTGRKKLLTFENPGNVNDWVADNHNQVRVAVSFRNDDAARKVRRTVYYRESNVAKWRELSSGYLDEPGWVPVGFDADDKTLFVVGRGEKDKAEIRKWDFATGQAGELVIAHPEVDVCGGEFGICDNFIYDENTGKVVGITVDALRPETYYFDDEHASLQAAIDQVLPARENWIQFNGDHALVSSFAETDLGKYYIYSTSGKTLELLFDASPHFKPELMAQTQILNYSARDGLMIPAYLTIPHGSNGRGLPLVVLVHGGPNSRDGWGFNPMVQQLASRGYAVFQPQFRMSVGLGWELFHSGWKQWGLAMQDDITDGVNKLIKDGTIDPARICIMGADYGGYAALFGMVKTPDLFKCAVSWGGITDIGLLYSVTWSDTAKSDLAKFDLRALHGDPDKDQDYIRKVSVLDNADKIKGPVMLGYGSEDKQVPMFHGEEVRDKLLKYGNTVDWMIFNGEGHLLAKEENAVRWGVAVQQFIDHNLGRSGEEAAR